jgi:hypothetical protein
VECYHFEENCCLQTIRLRRIKVYKNIYELSQDLQKRYLVYTQSMVIPQILKPPPPLCSKQGDLALSLWYAKTRASIASLPATIIPTQARVRTQMMAKDFAELDATFKKGGSNNSMGQGFGWACSSCFKKGHTREFCIKNRYKPFYGPVYDNLDLGNTWYKTARLPPR